jgi:NADP-dependent 3-hydroxy acid dehydrogenase YdfG
MTSTRDGQRKRSAVITGAGSGLGRDIALGLAAKGYRVFGAAMSLDEIADLKKASGGGRWSIDWQRTNRSGMNNVASV